MLEEVTGVVGGIFVFHQTLDGLALEFATCFLSQACSSMCAIKIDQAPSSIQRPCGCNARPA